MQNITPIIDKLPNVYLGKNARIITNHILQKDPRLNEFFNNETMGALDNYARHENIKIYITPLENDIFDDIAVTVFKNNKKKANFPISVAKTKEEVPEFFRNLYKKIQNVTSSSTETKFVPKSKHSKWEDFRMYVENVVDRYNEMRLSLLNK